MVLVQPRNEPLLPPSKYPLMNRHKNNIHTRLLPSPAMASCLQVQLYHPQFDSCLVGSHKLLNPKNKNTRNYPQQKHI